MPLCDQAAEEIAQLRAECIHVTDADVVELNDIALRLVAGEVGQDLARGRPVRCGNVTLWPLTLAGAAWYGSIGCRIGDGYAALAYAMAEGSTEAIDTATAREVRRWHRLVRATDAQLRAAVAEVHCQTDSPEDPPSRLKPEPSRNGLAELTARLQARIGGDAAFWERRCSLSYALRALEIATEIDHGTDKLERIGRIVGQLGWAAEKIRERERAKSNG